jgi:hypothetical protein
VTFGRDRLDLVADALGVGRVRPGDAIPPLWHWAVLPADCVTGTSVLVRFFRALREGAPAIARRSDLSAAEAWMEGGTDLWHQDQLRTQTLTAPLLAPSEPGPGTELRFTEEPLADDGVDYDRLLQLLGPGPGGSPVNRVLALLAAQRLRRRTGSQLTAVLFNFWSDPASLRACRRVVRVDDEGRVLFRVGVPGQPVALTGAAWFGCGPGSSR